MKITLKVKNLLIYLLSGYVLATLLQNYYSVYIHLLLFIACIFTSRCYNRKIARVLIVGVSTCLLFVLFAIFKGTFDPMTQVGVFLHYLTWPILFLLYKDRLSVTEKKNYINYIIGICIVNNILSLKVLFENREISRLLAGAATLAQRQEYFGKGVGGYGHVYAMVFFTIAALYWFLSTKDKMEKLFLFLFLITNYMFILFSSYTTAILLTLILTVFAFTMKTESMKATIIFSVIVLIILLFGSELLNVGINIANALQLNFVAKHLSQLQALQNASDYLTLRRSYFYTISWESFKSNPFTGGMSAGGHSHLLDCLAKMGVFGLSFFVCLYIFEKNCTDRSFPKPYFEMYLIFFIFTCIDTCEVAQLPLVLFFVCPMVFTLINSEEELSHV